MTVVNPKSISGINSITTGSGSDNLLTIHTSDASSTERVRINSSGDVIVGSGITVSPDGDIFATGVCTATSFSGDGSALTGIDLGAVTGATGDFSIADKIVHTGDTNTAIRFPAADTITAETGGTERARIDSGGNTNFGAEKSVALPSGTGIQVYHSANPRIKLVNDTTGNGATDGTQIYLSSDGDTIIDNKDSEDIIFHSNASEKLRIDSDGDVGIGDNNPDIRLTVVDSGTENLVRLGRSDGSSHGSHDVKIKVSKSFYHNFKMEASTYDLDCYNGSSMINALTIDTSGNATLNSGNLVMGTSGKGISFAATSDASGMDNELLDDYEEGSWSPIIGGWDTATYYSGSTYYYGWYIKVGKLIHVGWKIYYQNLTTVSSSPHVKISGLPYNSNSVSSGPVGHVRFDIPEFGMSGYPLVYLAANDSVLYMYKHVNGSNNLAAINATSNYSNSWTMGTATYWTV